MAIRFGYGTAFTDGVSIVTHFAGFQGVIAANRVTFAERTLAGFAVAIENAAQPDITAHALGTTAIGGGFVIVHHFVQAATFAFQLLGNALPLATLVAG